MRDEASVDQQAETISITGMPHTAAFQRVVIAIAQWRKSMTGQLPQPRLRDVCGAKAEILLSSEEAEAVRNYIR